MSSYNPANAQAQAVLQTLCKFILPLIQTAKGQAIDTKNISFGIEADEFVVELEKFISGMISRSQPRNQDIAIEAELGKDCFYHPKGDETNMGASSSDKGTKGDIATRTSTIRAVSVPRAMPLGANEEDLGKNLEFLREYVTQTMPIRLLYIEPCNSKLKITLMDRTNIYNRLVVKFRTDPHALAALQRGSWKPAQYAILSHTWNQTPGELTYADWKHGSLDDTQPKCRKPLNFCKAAYENHELTLGWIDTVCINKESSAELDEAIRSMYAWYRDAELCITYLACSKYIQDIHSDPWFTRGWTLQELVAPQRMKFYNMNWTHMSTFGDDKEYRIIVSEINLATTIKLDELKNIQGTSISRRMQLAANRQVTRGEDIAYCLMGIFDVSISTAYGEGADRAFFRLVEEIFRSTKDVSDIFNWGGDQPSGRPPTTSLFPSSPADYINRSPNNQLRTWHPIEPLTLTHLGLRTPVLLMPAIALSKSASHYPLPIGDYYADVSVDSVALCTGYFSSRPLPEKYRLLCNSVSGPASVYKVEQQQNEIDGLRWYKNLEFVKMTLTFGTLSVEEQGPSIHIPKTCLAVLLGQKPETSSLSYYKIHTKEPIVFNLKKAGVNFDGNRDEHYEIERSQLGNHGMQLVILYL